MSVYIADTGGVPVLIVQRIVVSARPRTIAASLATEARWLGHVVLRPPAGRIRAKLVHQSTAEDWQQHLRLVVVSTEKGKIES